MQRDEAQRILMQAKLKVAAYYPEMVLSEYHASIFALLDATTGNAASDLVPVFEKSVQNISTTLKRMFDAGWLERRKIAQSSGGYEWYYTVKTPGPQGE